MTRAAQQISPYDVQRMVRHWLNTPLNGYLGDDFGNNLPDYLQSPNTANGSSEIMRKMYSDLPVLQLLPSGSISVQSFSDPQISDRMNVLVTVFGEVITVVI